MRAILLLVALLIGNVTAVAQEPGGRPAPSNVQAAAFPRINDDGTVTFRISADKAQSVTVNLSTLPPVPLARTSDGAWMGTTAAPVRPGFYYYRVNVDGFVSTDPGSRMFYAGNRWTSGLDVPGPDWALYAPRDVPHGVVREQLYFAASRNEWRVIRIYTPPGYDTDPTTRYPVLYLQHGNSENETGWTLQGRAQYILDNLLAEGRVRPMIVVNENGMMPAAAGAGARGGNTAFDEMVVRDLVPFIDRTYRTIAHRDSRAIAGLSMGAGQAMRIGLGRPDLFSAVGAFSSGMGNTNPATAYGGRMADAEAFNQQTRVLFIGMGIEDERYESAKAAHERLEQAGIRHTWFESPGGHTWTAWRRHLVEFAPLLFR